MLILSVSHKLLCGEKGSLDKKCSSQSGFFFLKNCSLKGSLENPNWFSECRTNLLMYLGDVKKLVLSVV